MTKDLKSIRMHVWLILLFVLSTLTLLFLQAFKFLIYIEEWYSFLPYMYYKLRLSMQ